MIVLASASPRRRELLERAGWRLRVCPAAVDETARRRESPSAYVLRLAKAKARAITLRHPRQGTVILGADTTVAIGRFLLAKPESAAAAAAMLGCLSGRRHTVLTGVCLRDPFSGHQAAAVAVTRVWFAPLTDRQIAAYVETGEPRDKAGGYAIQGGAAGFVRRLEGSYSNVVGLPVGLVWELWLELFAPGGGAPALAVAGGLRSAAADARRRSGRLPVAALR